MTLLATQTLTGYRIGDNAARFAIYSAEGSRISPGRWNTATSPMIYLSQNYSTAMLEKLVYANGIMPSSAHFISVTIPVGVSCETFSVAHYPGWADQDKVVARAYGQTWYDERRSAILIVPSVVARHEKNFLLNPTHPDFGKITPNPIAEPVWWDTRLFPPTITP